MPRLRVIDRDGAELEINAPAGTSLMEPLRDMDDGVTAICGGMCSCATCHVYIDEAWVPKLPAAMSDETDMLKDLTSYRPATSRLSCQIQLVDALADEPSLRAYHFLPSVRGDFLLKLGRTSEARSEFERAAFLAKNVREREFLLGRARAC